TAEIPAQTLDPTGVAAGVKRFRADISGATAGFDWPLLAAAVGLVICSMILLNGATQDDVPGSPNYYLMRQGVFAAVGLSLMLIVSRIDYTRLRDMRTQIYAVLIATNLLVLLAGAASRGSRRWFDLGFFQFQPSELGKVLLILTLAALVADRSRDRNALRVTVAVLGLAAFPAALVFLQPDLGTALVYGAITLAIIFIGGLPWQHIAAILTTVVMIGAIVLWAAPAAGVNVLHDYQVQRLTAFLHPNEDPSGQGYQQAQAQIAIGAGERTGRGSADSTQTQLNFLPEHHTDFVFAVVGESYGFAGAAMVLTLYALLLWRALRVLTSARDQFGAMIVAGVVAILMFQVFVNVGMNVGIMPITGVTLPMMSYGGSSMLVTFILLGLVESVAIQSRGPRHATSPI
ncbi:MAG TPA: rod shape-determining protein RodA, partial [Solirubrobacterales bacterium]|nr:rod shape-determining protein RodA [Solirubrobacterales bacterium]